jgi:hypothetical protein
MAEVNVLRQHNVIMWKRPQFMRSSDGYEIHRRVGIMVLAGSVAAYVLPLVADAQPKNTLSELQRRAIVVLRNAMREGEAYEKVHAAEALICCGLPEGVNEYFVEQDRIGGSDTRYRTGIWRVLFRINASSPAAQQRYLQKILAVLYDDKAQDRGRAAETLGKLQYAEHTRLVLDLAEHGRDDMRVSARWILANSGRAEDEARLAELLRSKSELDRYYTACVFRYFKTIRPATMKALCNLASEERANGKVRCYVLGTLYTHLSTDQRGSVNKELLEYVISGSTEQRYQACMALANWPTEEMIPVVERLLPNTSHDERVGGAYVLLRMGQSHNKMAPDY